MVQLINESTHEAGNILDLLFVTHPMLVSGYSIGPPLSLSDHYSINFDVPLSISTPKKLFRNFNDCKNMISFLDGTNWDQVFVVCNTVDQYWAAFCDVINFGIKKAKTIRQKLQSNCRNMGFPLSNFTRETIATKKRAWKLFKQTRLHVHKIAHNRVSRRCKQLVYNDRLCHERRLSLNCDNKQIFPLRYIFTQATKFSFNT